MNLDEHDRRIHLPPVPNKDHLVLLVSFPRHFLENDQVSKSQHYYNKRKRQLKECHLRQVLTIHFKVTI